MKFYKFFLVGAVVCTTFFGHAQSLSPEVLSSAGGKITSSNISVDWTLGETAVSRWVRPNGGLVTEGFHQPKLEVSKVESTSHASINIAPNPVQSILQLTVKHKEAKPLSATLIDVQGKILMELNRLEVGTIDVEMQQYPSGVYFLALRYSNEPPFQSFKVVKTQ